MPFLLPPTPHALHATVPQVVLPLAFQGYAAGMPLPAAKKMIASSGGTLLCRPTTDPRMRDCSGTLRLAGTAIPFGVLISSINDSAAVIVFSSHRTRQPATWVATLTAEYGIPNHAGGRSREESWQWIRRGSMLRIVERGLKHPAEASVTLTYGPLLDGLGPPKTVKPD